MGPPTNDKTFAKVCGFRRFQFQIWRPLKDPITPIAANRFNLSYNIRLELE